jgi:hypothetical protein
MSQMLFLQKPDKYVERLLEEEQVYYHQPQDKVHDLIHEIFSNLQFDYANQ